VRDALGRLDGVALEVVADADEEVEVVAVPRDLRGRAGAAVDAVRTPPAVSPSSGRARS
jgi:hypothetical protein